ncbi:contractile injection system tape measure protein [Bacteroides sp.]
MITLGTVKFDFLTDNEPFARRLNGRWDTFFATAFERVADEVLSAFDTPDRMIAIDSLQLDLKTIPEDDFERHFAARLREALKDYMRRWTNADTSVASQAGVRLMAAGHAALDILCFFLLHGYLPHYTDAGYTDLHFLLAKVVSESAYRFREFLESYGHYDFLCRRLVFSFTDDELEEIVRVVQPSESKFVNLYVRVQLRSYHALKRPGVTRDDYRGVVWTLVFAYLFSESRSRFSRKQVMMHTLRGIAAHFNIKFAELTRLMTGNMAQLERTVGQLPELWSLLKEIRQDVRAELYALDGDYRRHLWREILSALQSGNKGDADFLLSYVHVCYVLSDPFTRRELLRQLQEPQIHRLVGIIVPAEQEYVISYSRYLDKSEEAGVFTGKAGSDFRVLKWEFIFAVLLSLPASAFSRKQFVLSVAGHLAAHYNLDTDELIHLLAKPGTWRGISLPSGLLAVLQELSADTAFLQSPEKVRRFVSTHTEPQIVAFVSRFVPVHSGFVVSYAALLDKGHAAGMLQGKAGGEFRALKWEFILSCLFMDKGVAFNQKQFVYSVLQRLAAHYNEEVTELIAYFLRELSVVLAESPFVAVQAVLQELEAMLTDRAEQSPTPTVPPSPRRDGVLLRPENTASWNKASDKELEQWALTLFGTDVPACFNGQERYLENWLVYFLNERKEIFRILWRAGRLNTPFVLLLVNRTPALRSLWLHRIGDERLLALYRRWATVYATLSTCYREYGFLQPAGEYLTTWMVELTSRNYSAWSEAEIIRFLVARLQRIIPPGLGSWVEKIQPVMGNKLTEIIEYIDKLKNEEIMGNSDREETKIEVNNAGLSLLIPYFPMLFSRMGYLTDDRSDFKDRDSQIRAVFLLQYILNGKEQEWPETELYLNKVFVGLTDWKNPLPPKVELTREEKECVDGLLEGVRHNWDKMRNTSVLAFRMTFLQRKGTVTHAERDKCWRLRVEEKAYDVLLDSLPWSFKVAKLPGMKERIEVQWR